MVVERIAMRARQLSSPFQSALLSLRSISEGCVIRPEETCIWHGGLWVASLAPGRFGNFQSFISCVLCVSSLLGAGW